MSSPGPVFISARELNDNSMRSVTFTIPGDPRGKGRPRFSGKSGRAYTPKETTEYEKLVRQCWCQQIHAPPLFTPFLEGEIRADIRAYFRIPKSESKRHARDLAQERSGYPKKPDVDNIAKIVLDALNGLAYEDDRSVTYLTIGKLYGAEPRVEVTLTEVRYTYVW